MRRVTLRSLAALLLAAAPLAAQVESAASVRAPEMSVVPAAPAALSPLSAPLASPLAALTPAAVSPEAAPLAAAAIPAPAALAPAALAPAALSAAPASALPAGGATNRPAAAGGAPARADAGAAARSELDGLEGGASAQNAAFDGASAAAGDALAARAYSVEPKDFPGGSGAVLTTGLRFRALLTKNLAPSDLPYSTTLRAPQAVSLPASLQTADHAPVKSVTDVVFASEEHSGSAGLVRLGALADGRPVALKAYHLRSSDDVELHRFTLEEARSAKLLSDLGVGPLYHGVWRDPGGSWNVVFDIARGDFNGTPVTWATFRDLETILARLKGAGVRSFGDLQLYRDSDGRLSVIDPGSAASGHTAHAAPDAPGGYATGVRMEQLHAADAGLGRRYLLWLIDHRPDAYRALREQIARRDDDYSRKIKDRYPEIFGAPATP